MGECINYLSSQIPTLIPFALDAEFGIPEIVSIASNLSSMGPLIILVLFILAFSLTGISVFELFSQKNTVGFVITLLISILCWLCLIYMCISYVFGKGLKKLANHFSFLFPFMNAADKCGANTVLLFIVGFFSLLIGCLTVYFTIDAFRRKKGKGRFNSLIPVLIIGLPTISIFVILFTKHAVIHRRPKNAGISNDTNSTIMNSDNINAINDLISSRGIGSLENSFGIGGLTNSRKLGGLSGIAKDLEMLPMI